MIIQLHDYNIHYTHNPANGAPPQRRFKSVLAPSASMAVSTLPEGATAVSYTRRLPR
jgi:hypothetical protein